MLHVCIWKQMGEKFIWSEMEIGNEKEKATHMICTGKLKKMDGTINWGREWLVVVYCIYLLISTTSSCTWPLHLLCFPIFISTLFPLLFTTYITTLLLLLQCRSLQLLLFYSHSSSLSLSSNLNPSRARSVASTALSTPISQVLNFLLGVIFIHSSISFLISNIHKGFYYYHLN